MQKEVPFNNLIKKQEYVDHTFRLQTGEVLNDPFARGMVGWLDETSKDPGSPKIASMAIVGIKFGLYVFPKYRKPELKIGSDLLVQLLSRLKTKKYQQLNINIITPDLLNFYTNNLENAKETGLIKSFISDPVNLDNELSHYTIHITL